MRVLGVLLGAIALLGALPDPGWAFGPATHVYLGSRLLNALYLLPGALATLIRAHPRSFIYGSIAADISFGKKYVPEGRHCHYWSVGEEIYETAANARLRAVGLGYLCHLAADTIAHNFFIPRQLVLTSSTRALGHSYWEHRLDARVGPDMSTRAREVVMDYDHSEADALFDEVLSGTIFSFETNRRIFRGMIRIQDNERWQAVFERVVHQSRWDLDAERTEAYLSRAFDYMIDYLIRRARAVAVELDPTGEANLRIAKRVRREALRDGAWRDPTQLHDIADEYFPLPTRTLDYWERSRGADPLANGADGSAEDRPA